MSTRLTARLFSGPNYITLIGKYIELGGKLYKIVDVGKTDDGYIRVLHNDSAYPGYQITGKLYLHPKLINKGDYILATIGVDAKVRIFLSRN